MVCDHVSMLERESVALLGSIDQDPLIGSVIRGDASRGDYVAFLGSTYHYVRWSGSLLAETAQGLRRRGYHSWLVEMAEAKAGEESPHYGWVLADLERCGEDPELVKVSEVPIAVQAYVNWSRTMAEQGSPAFLGAAYMLERISMCRAKMAAVNLRAHAVIPHIENAVSFLDGHGDADSDHVARLESSLRRIEDPGDQAAIQLCAEVLRALYPRFFHPASRTTVAASTGATP